MNEGIGRRCFICEKIITEEDKEKNNPPMRMMSIPGFIHRKCKKDTESFVINTAFNIENIEKEKI